MPSSSPISSVNDFVVRFANVNGSGSASANELFALLDMDVAVIEQLVREQFKSKEKLIDANLHALHLGRDWALQNLQCPIGLRVRNAKTVGDRIFLEGNSAAALGAVYGGATVC